MSPPSRLALAALVIGIELTACRSLLDYEDATELDDGGAGAAPDTGARSLVPAPTGSASDLDGGTPDASPPEPLMDAGLGAPDARSDGSADADAGPPRSCPALVPGAADPISCEGLGSICGATQNGPCCAQGAVPAGTYRRRDENSDAFPVTLSAYRLDLYEVTVGRFRRWADTMPLGVPAECDGRNPGNPDDLGWDPAWTAKLVTDRNLLSRDLGCDADASWTDSAGPNENRPMTCVTWYEAAAFCVWDHGRLPTEAEWQIAAAGGDLENLFPWGEGHIGDPRYAIANCNYPLDAGGCTTAPVGTTDLGAALWRHLDLAGNAAEWVVDLASESYAVPCVDCASLGSAGARIYRGGDFQHSSDVTFRTFNRGFGEAPERREGSLGFRCARAP